MLSDHVLRELGGDTNSFLDDLEGHTLEVICELSLEDKQFCQRQRSAYL